MISGGRGHSEGQGEQNGGGASFIAREDLEPVPNVNRAMKEALDQLRSPKWDRQLEATTTLRRIAKYQPEALRPHMGTLMKDLFGKDGVVMSLRSNLSRNALACCG